MNNSSKLRCAVIGLGMGKNHAMSYHEGPDSELVAVADLDSSRLALWKNIVSSDGLFTDYKKLLEVVRPDVVSVALPNCLHATVTIDCLQAGSHVLCEKPMAMNVADAMRMRDEAEKSGRVLGINFSQRFNDKNRFLKSLVEEGGVGEIYHAFVSWTRRDGMPKFGGWFGQKALSGGGPLIDLGVHRIDIAIWLMGSPQPISANAVLHHRIGVPRAKEQNEKFDVEDLAAGLIRFENGASLIFEISWAGLQTQHEQQSMRLTGTKGAIEQTDSGIFYTTTKADRYITAEVDPGAVVGSKPGLKSEMRKSYFEFIHCLKSDLPFGATPDDGIRIQSILDALYESAASGREVKI